MRTSAFPLAPDRFGVTGGSPPRKWAKLPDDARRRRIAGDVALMKQAGVRWTRVGMPAGDPPAPFLDFYLQQLRENNIDVLGFLSFNAPPTDGAAFRQNLGRLVRAYPQIRVWEAGNEPNLSMYWKAPLETYVPALQMVYQGVKSADATRQVSCAGISEWKVEPFLEQLVRQQAWQWMDLFAFHPYAPTPDAVAGKVVAARKKLEGTPLHDKALWITEIGFHTAANWKNNAGHVADESVKANYLEQTFAKLADLSQGPIFWYTFQEDFAGTTLGYGLLNQAVDAATAAATDPNAAAPPRVVYSAAYERFRQLAAGKAPDTAAHAPSGDAYLLQRGRIERGAWL